MFCDSFPASGPPRQLIVQWTLLVPIHPWEATVLDGLWEVLEGGTHRRVACGCGTGPS